MSCKHNPLILKPGHGPGRIRQEEECRGARGARNRGSATGCTRSVRIEEHSHKPGHVQEPAQGRSVEAYRCCLATKTSATLHETRRGWSFVEIEKKQARVAYRQCHSKNMSQADSTGSKERGHGAHSCRPCDSLATGRSHRGQRLLALDVALP